MNISIGYGMWFLTVFSILFFTLFALGFFFPRKKREWQTLGVFEAFIVALYTEMYGFPLTIYILSSLFGLKIPFVHFKGHLWATIFGLGNTGAWLEMIIGGLVMVLGMGFVTVGWWRIHRAKDKLVTDGIYALIRHPQYSGFIFITTGMLIHWPTLPTLIMFPVLVGAYLHLAKKEETELIKKFGESYLRYKKLTPAFVPFKAGSFVSSGVDNTNKS